MVLCPELSLLLLCLLDDRSPDRLLPSLRLLFSRDRSCDLDAGEDETDDLEDPGREEEIS